MGREIISGAPCTASTKASVQRSIKAGGSLAKRPEARPGRARARAGSPASRRAAPLCGQRGPVGRSAPAAAPRLAPLRRATHRAAAQQPGREAGMVLRKTGQSAFPAASPLRPIWKTAEESGRVRCSTSSEGSPFPSRVRVRRALGNRWGTDSSCRLHAVRHRCVQESSCGDVRARRTVPAYGPGVRSRRTVSILGRCAVSPEYALRLRGLDAGSAPAPCQTVQTVRRGGPDRRKDKEDKEGYRGVCVMCRVMKRWRRVAGPSTKKAAARGARIARGGTARRAPLRQPEGGTR